MVTYNKFEDFVEQLGKGVHQLHAAGHTLRVFLSDVPPNARTDTIKSDITEIAAGNGYTAGGEDIQNDWTETSGSAELSGTTVIWSATGPVGPFRYIVLYNDDPISPADPLIAWWDYGTSITLKSGETFTLQQLSPVFTLDASQPAQGLSVIIQNYDDGQVPKEYEPDGAPYPQFYTSFADGTLTAEAGGVNPSGFHLKFDYDTDVSGTGIDIHWNPLINSSDKGFLYEHAQEISKWVDNTLNRMSLWIKYPSNYLSPRTDGRRNQEWGTYCKNRTNPSPSSNEEGGDHFYHFMNPLPDAWNKFIFNWFPSTARGVAGSIDIGSQQYPTSGDPPNTYNYFDTMTRLYIEDVQSGPFGVYLMDELKVYEEPYTETENGLVKSICAAYRASDNTIHLSWYRHKDYVVTPHVVKYAFSNIHVLGWDNATPVPTTPAGGSVDPPPDSGPYNGMLYQTTSIDVSGKSEIYLGIKPDNSTYFSQIHLPFVS